MKLIFGLDLDDRCEPRPATAEGGVFYCGKNGLLASLEAFLGLSGHPDDIEYLRIEQYRQALISLQSSVHSRQSAVSSGPRESNPLRFHSLGQLEDTELTDAPQPITVNRQTSTPNPLSFFYQRSFEADQFATATELLARRDELKLAGWDFQKKDNTPERLAVLAAIEALFVKEKQEENDLHLPPGYADRFCEVLEKLDSRLHPYKEIWLNEPLELLPCHFQRLFKKLSETSEKPAIQQLPLKLPGDASSDLAMFQKKLAQSKGSKGKHTAQADGSLFLLKAKRASDAAIFIAQLLRVNQSSVHSTQSPVRSHPSPITHHQSLTALIPEKNRLLDTALIQEGLPSLGIESASLARPTLQILKLVPTFLWEPVNPFKILEFVSLAVKPLADELATLIANQIAKSPGLQGEGWYAMINRYFDDIAEKEPPKVANEQRRQYNFWFERQRYDMGKTVPKQDVVDIFSYLREWSLKAFEDSGSKNNSLIVLGEQAKRITELLRALPETALTYLELERIVRTVYEPAPVVFQPEEAGRMPYVTQPGAFIGPVDAVLWWNFTQNETPHFFSRWYKLERAYLEQLGVHPNTPEQENARTIWQRTRPVLCAKNRLLLVLPQSINGEDAQPHPLFGDLEATFSNLGEITYDLDSEAGKANFGRFFKIPEKIGIKPRRLGRPKAFLQLRSLEQMERDYETLTSLETLFYYPYQWFFRYKIKLNKSSILSVVSDNTLMGNLAHRVFERLLKEEGIYQFDKNHLDHWIEAECRRLLQREGAVLLMYGREPERIAFINKLKYAAWSLLSLIRDNGWKVRHTEVDLEGIFPAGHERPVPVRGIADLVLERGHELAVLDLKWRGGTFREGTIRNEEDLQLVLYARLLSAEGEWAHSAYFIIEKGRLIARNNQAFRGITPIAPGEDYREVNERILRRMEATWQWRNGQLAKGEIEIRCRQTLSEIEEKYSSDGQGELMLQILEMKGEDAKYDDYRTLINLMD